MAGSPAITVVVVTTNGLRFLDDCLSGLRAQTVACRVVLVDNCSDDGSAEFAAAAYPEVQVVRTPRRVGYGPANQLGLARAATPFVCVLNDDTALAPDLLEELLASAAANPRAGIFAPLILQFGADTVNAAGNRLHVSCMCGPRAKGEPRATLERGMPLACASGTAFVVRREVLDAVLGFSDDFQQFDPGHHTRMEDADLCLRALLAGWDVVYVPSAVVWHKYAQRPLTADRFAAMELGRYLMLLRVYEPATLLSLAPVLAFVEAMTWGYAALRGRQYARSKARVVGWLATHPGELRAMRRRVQRTRARADADVLGILDTELEVAHLVGSVVGTGAERVVAAVSRAVASRVVARS